MGRRQQGRGDPELTSPAAAAGDWAEELAARYLQSAGCSVLARNYRLRGGELDIVCEDDRGVVVFVEVKQRSSSVYGGAAAAIDGRKLARLRQAATHYLNYALRRPEAAARFDAVLVTGDRERHSIEHLKDIA